MVASVSFHAKIALVYAWFFMFSWMLGLVPGTAVVAVFLLLLGEIHRIKYGATGQPLVFHDIHVFHQALELTGYASWRLWVLLAIFLGGGAVLVLRSLRQRSKPDIARKTRGKSLVVLCVAVGLAGFSLYPAFMGDLIGHIDAASFYRRFGISRLHFDGNQNFRQNGLLMHLVMTSQSRSIGYYSPEAVAEDARSITSGMNFSSRATPLPKKIVFVLCESCWRGPREKSVVFSGGGPRAVQAFRMLSPVYGGGTPNAEFEVLTGLPARGLSGILYQEYGDRFSVQSATVASMLRDVGYQSLVMHNFERKMWQGDIVYPRLGFDHFIAIDEMGYEGQGGYPPDSVMYAAAEKALEEGAEKRQFLFLITMYSHGPYKNNDGDNGFLDFQKRLEKAEDDLDVFQKNLAERYGSDYLMVVFADHRPGLAAHFFHSGEFPKAAFDKVGVKDDDFKFSSRVLDHWNVVGDVPVAITGSGIAKEAFQSLQGKPLYCLSPVVFSDNLGLNNPLWQAMLANCQGYDGAYRDHYEKYPKSFYYHTLFR